MKAHGFRTGLLLVIFGAAFTVPTRADMLDDTRSLLQQGRHDAAIERIDAHLKAFPNDSKARFLKGVAFAESGRRQAAIDTFQDLVKDFPELPEPYNNLAVLHAASGELEKARFFLLEAIRIHPSYATAHENLGDVYGKMAALSYSKALTLNSASRSARAKLALAKELGEIAGGIRTASSPAKVPAPSAAVAAAQPVRPTSTPSPGEVEDDVLATLRNWADAWSSQNVDAYLGHYAESFVPEDGRSRESWTILRRKRVSGPQFIDLGIASPEVIRIDENRASVTFEQSYRSDSYADRVVKQIDLLRQGGRWKILSERTIN